MKIHLISIGGSAMHNLAIALHKKGYKVSGSDDEIFEPSKSRLEKHKLLPAEIGWDESRIHQDIDVVIVGMHARENNPELLKARELKLKIVSYPEFIYQQSTDKKRVVIGGSHGKTTITAMILHVLHQLKIDCDYLVGAQLEGFDTMVRLSDAPLIIIEGDEYLSSPIDRRPKFLWYKPHIAVISGIAWDHINVFPTFKDYLEQFRLFIESIAPAGSLIYCERDEKLNALVGEMRNPIQGIPYNIPEHRIENGKTILIDNSENQETEVQVFGDHNLENLNAAMKVCEQLGVHRANFLKSIQSFRGAARRMQLIAENQSLKIFKDFAHAPSKLKASCKALKKQFPDKRIIAAVELHTFSSLNKEFLKQYSGSMNQVDEAMVYFNPHTIAHKGLENIESREVKAAFSPSEIKVFNQSDQLLDYLKNLDLDNSVLVFMTSGNFDGIPLDELGKQLAVTE